MLVLRELTLTSLCLRVFIAVVIGGALGYERERRNRPAGLRTYMLVCLGSCICMIINQYAVQVYGSGDPVRLGAQVISGIGFLGAGSILINGKNRVSGLTTAAGLWAAACLGLAVGIGLYEVAIIGGITTFFVLTALSGVDTLLQRRRKIIDVYMESRSASFLGDFIRYIRENNLQLVDLISDTGRVDAIHGISFVATVKSKEGLTRDNILELLRAMPTLQYIEEI